MKIHLIMPMAGRGSRFSRQGFDIPKPMIEIYGSPFFYWAVQSVGKFVDMASLDFVILQEHIERYGLDRKIKEYFPQACIHALPEVTEGAVITCIKGAADILDDAPLVFNDCDHLFRCNEFSRFCQTDHGGDTDGILLTFVSDEPKFSFIGKDEVENVTRTVEKEVISDEAICGCYYFRNKKIFMEAAKEYLTKCNYKEYFMSGVYNVMLEKKQRIKSMRTDFHVPFGVPEEYEAAKKDRRYEELV